MMRVQVLSVLWLVVVVVSAKGVRRQLDPQHGPLQVMVEQLASDVAEMKAQLEAQRQEIAQLQDPSSQGQGVIGFSSYVADADGKTIQAHQGALIPFHTVVTNAGGAYNATASAFVVPVAGVYFIAVSVDCTHDYSNGLHVLKNGVVVLDADKDDSQRDHVNAVGVLQLAVGDVLTCVHADSHGGVDAGIESTFSGFLIK